MSVLLALFAPALAFAAMAKERVGALLVLVDSMFSSHGTRLANLAAKNRLPAAYTNRLLVEVGGLMSYGPSFSDLWRRAAGYVDISKHVGRVNRESIVIDAVAA